MKQKGLYNKYEVYKNDALVHDRCFVLKPESDPAALEALRAYAQETPNVQLSTDLLNWIFEIEEQSHLINRMSCSK